MFETLKRLYGLDKIDKEALKRAVSEKRWITPEQYGLIVDEPYLV